MSIREALLEQRNEILRLAVQYGARNVRIFGSVAKGTDVADSDVDFLVEMEAERSLTDRVAFLQKLEDLLGCRVDVVSERALHWFVRDKILNEAIPL